MRILVTGAGGRIGGRLVKALRESGDWVRGFDVQAARPGLEPDDMALGGLQDRSALESAVRDIDAVVHLAALMSWLPQDADRLFEINVQGTFNLLQVASQVKLVRFVFASSGEVYPELNPAYLPIDEAHPTRPTSIYGLTKLLGEEMVQHFGRRAGMPFCILRFAHTQDPSELLDPDSFFSGPRFYVNAKIRQLRKVPSGSAVENSIAALEAVATPQEQHYIGCDPDGKPYKMGICDVRDMVSGILLGLRERAAAGEAFNIGPEHAFEFDQAIPYLAKRTGLNIVPVRLYTASYRYETTVEKAMRMLGYAPQYSIYQMIDDAVAKRDG